MTDRTAPATIRDVALRAGVSTATVSRVLAGIGNPHPDTAAAVQAAAEDLEYRPSGVARSLRMKRTRTLGLIVTDIQNPFFPELVQAADLTAREMGYSILLGSAAYDKHRATHYLRLMVDRRVDGVIVATSQLDPEITRRLVASPIPVVVVNAEAPGFALDVITSDNAAGARLSAEHLIDLGHRRIAYVRGAKSFTADIPRVEGFRDACRDAGLSAEDTPEVRGNGQYEGGEEAATQLIGRDPMVTAIACYNDMTAIGVMRSLRAAGLSVPHDISVIGCDDIAAASWVVPTLTTVAQDKAALGRMAVERLATTLDHPAETPTRETIRLPMILRRRESTGRAPSEQQAAPHRGHQLRRTP